MTAGSRASVIAIVAILLGLGGYEIFKPGTGEEPAAAPPTAAPSPAAPPPAAEPAAATPAPAAEPAPAAAPSFDLVRVESDGSAVVAGQVAPAAKISLLLDGAQVASATGNDTGNFVAIFSLPASDKARLLTLQATLADGSTLNAPASVAIAPTAAPSAPAATADAVPADAPAADAPAADAAAPASAAPDSSAPAALAVTDSGATLLQGATPVAPGTVTLDVISYPSTEAVQFGGKGSAGAFVRLYLDNAPIGEAVTVGVDGNWSMTQTGIAPGVYTLRADELDGAGKVISRYETPFKRETPEALAQAAAPSTAPTAATGTAPEPLSGDAGTPAPAPLAGNEATAPAPAAPAPAAPATASVAEAGTQSGALSDQPAPTATAPTSPEVGAAPAPSTAQPEATPAATAPEAPVAEAAAAPQVTAPAAPEPAPAQPAPVTITVQPGYTLWGIAKTQLGDGVLYVQVFKANKDKIRNPDLIYPGQIFTVPQR